jgi:hypothetical protein
LFCDTNSYIKEITCAMVARGVNPRRQEKVRHMEWVSTIGDESRREYGGPVGAWPAAQHPATA